MKFEKLSIFFLQIRLENKISLLQSTCLLFCYVDVESPVLKSCRDPHRFISCKKCRVQETLGTGA